MTKKPSAAQWSVSDWMNLNGSRSSTIRYAHALVVSLDNTECNASSYRSVDASVAEAVGWKKIRRGFWTPTWTGVNPRTRKREIIPHFTTSLDAVRSIIPKGWFESYTRSQDGKIIATCTCPYRCKIFHEYTCNLSNPAIAVLRVILLGMISEWFGDSADTLSGIHFSSPVK